MKLRASSLTGGPKQELVRRAAVGKDDVKAPVQVSISVNVPERDRARPHAPARKVHRLRKGAVPSPEQQLVWRGMGLPCEVYHAIVGKDDVISIYVAERDRVSAQATRARKVHSAKPPVELPSRSWFGGP